MSNAPTQHDLCIRRGSTFREVVRWETEPWRSAAIESITRGPSTRIVTQSDHGILPGWRVAVSGARGLDEFNIAGHTPTEAELRRATVIDQVTVEFNGVGSIECRPHRAGTGWLIWQSPHDLSGYVARMAIRRRTGGELLHTLTSDVDGGIVIDDSMKTITLEIGHELTEAFAWRTGVYDLELESPDGDVFAVLAGCVSVADEITTPTP